MIEMQVIATHQVDDIEHWFNSPKRAAFFEAHGMKVTPFKDPAGSDSVTAVVIETPDMERLQSALGTDEARQAQQHDGVHADTIRILLADWVRQLRPESDTRAHL